MCWQIVWNVTCTSLGMRGKWDEVGRGGGGRAAQDTEVKAFFFSKPEGMVIYTHPPRVDPSIPGTPLPASGSQS